MKGFGKVAGIGLIAICLALVAMSSLGVVFAQQLAGPLTVEVPRAQLEGVDMYGGIYVHSLQDETVTGNDIGAAVVIVQEIDKLSCPEGQTITRTIEFAGTTVLTKIHMDSAVLDNILMKATGLTSNNGTLYDVTMEAMTDMPKTPDDLMGLEQTIADGAMYNLTSDAYFVSMDSLAYTGMTVTLDVTY